MGRNGSAAFLISAIALAATGAAPPGFAASLSAEGAHGHITLNTGTQGGACRRESTQLVCEDGDRIATASLERGCARVEGGALCEVLRPPRRRVVTPNANSIEVECETGAKKGYVYLISDVDGKGACAAEYNGNGDVIGGSCFKGRDTCALVDCNHGCVGVSLNCSCHIQSRPRQSVSAAD